MVEPRENICTARLRHACRSTHAGTFGLAAQAVTEALAARPRTHPAAARTRRDAARHRCARTLCSGLNWWQVADYLSTHPQDTWELYQSTVKGTPSPAAQHPDLAVWLSVGADIVHELDPAYGADLDDLNTTHSLHTDPTVLRLREASVLLSTDIWIAVWPPGEPAPDIGPGAVAVAWSSVASTHQRSTMHTRRCRHAAARSPATACPQVV